MNEMVMIPAVTPDASPFLPVQAPIAMARKPWKIEITNMEKTSAQSSANPNLAPAMLAVVTVPGPMNAAATRIPGPNLLLAFVTLSSSGLHCQIETLPGEMHMQ